MPIKDPDKAAFYMARRAVIDRGIGWTLTQAEWREVWKASGEYETGRRTGHYVLARCDESRPYAAGNVVIVKRGPPRRC